MPIWIIIIQLIISLPKIWDTIKDIWEYIQKMRKGEEKKLATERYKKLLLDVKKNKAIPLATQNEFDALRRDLGIA